MSKILFMNCSPNESGNTEQLLRNLEHDVVQMSDYRICQYGQVYHDDQMIEVMNKIRECDTLVMLILEQY